MFDKTVFLMEALLPAHIKQTLIVLCDIFASNSVGGFRHSFSGLCMTDRQSDRYRQPEHLMSLVPRWQTRPYKESPAAVPGGSSGSALL